MTWPTMRAAREPMVAATSPYVITRPGGMASTTSSTRSTKEPPSSPGAWSEIERTDRLAVLGLADGLEAAAQEELLRTQLARLPDDVEPLVTAGPRFVGEGVHGEGADAAALVVRIHVDPPEDRLELVVLGVRVEVAHDEADDLVAVEDDALPRGVGVDDGRRGRVGHRSDELLLARLQCQCVRRHDGPRAQLFQSQLSHDERVTCVSDRSIAPASADDSPRETVSMSR